MYAYSSMNNKDEVNLIKRAGESRQDDRLSQDTRNICIIKCYHAKRVYVIVMSDNDAE